MKSVLISIRKEWIEKIVDGKKTVEVRKSAPKEVPFKAYIYCTNKIANGKVIGEFICDKIYHIKAESADNGSAECRHKSIETFLPSKAGYKLFLDMCLKTEELFDYLGEGKWGYGWHISDLKIYDKPKELSEFSKPCPVADRNCENCLSLGKPYNWDFDEKKGEIYCTRRVIRPPQSWQYVEELK